MKKYGVKVGFYTETNEILYHRYFPITEESEEKAINIVKNVLYVMEFHNFRIEEVKEIEH